MSSNLTTAASEIVLHCEEIDSALAYYTGSLGFRLDMIFPADAPRVAELSGYGINLHLHTNAPQGAISEDWHVGRAGMHYRDLIPGRQGGAMIASHIRIPDGGPVPDYVHYHDIGFQIIYTYKGWVRVVYEDQGPPFVMREGDCVLQPPEIRHRVLENSDAFEVVEIGSPAEHETFVDHDMTLPNETVDPERIFNGQHFIFHQAAEAAWQSWDFDGFEVRDTGIAEATNGVGSVVVIRPTRADASATLHSESTIQFGFLLQGSLDIQAAEASNRLEVGQSFSVASGEACNLSECSEDLELLLASTKTGSGRSE